MPLQPKQVAKRGSLTDIDLPDVISIANEADTLGSVLQKAIPDVIKKKKAADIDFSNIVDQVSRRADKEFGDAQKAFDNLKAIESLPKPVAKIMSLFGGEEFSKKAQELEIRESAAAISKHDRTLQTAAQIRDLKFSGLDSTVQAAKDAYNLAVSRTNFGIAMNEEQQRQLLEDIESLDIESLQTQIKNPESKFKNFVGILQQELTARETGVTALNASKFALNRAEIEFNIEALSDKDLEAELKNPVKFKDHLGLIKKEIETRKVTDLNIKRAVSDAAAAEITKSKVSLEVAAASRKEVLRGLNPLKIKQLADLAVKNGGSIFLDKNGQFTANAKDGILKFGATELDKAFVEVSNAKDARLKSEGDITGVVDDVSAEQNVVINTIQGLIGHGVSPDRIAGINARNAEINQQIKLATSQGDPRRAEAAKVKMKELTTEVETLVESVVNETEDKELQGAIRERIRNAGTFITNNNASIQLANELTNPGALLGSAYEDEASLFNDLFQQEVQKKGELILTTRPGVETAIGQTKTLAEREAVNKVATTHNAKFQRLMANKVKQGYVATTLVGLKSIPGFEIFTDANGNLRDQLPDGTPIREFTEKEDGTLSRKFKERVFMEALERHGRAINSGINLAELFLERFENQTSLEHYVNITHEQLTPTDAAMVKLFTNNRMTAAVRMQQNAFRQNWLEATRDLDNEQQQTDRIAQEMAAILSNKDRKKQVEKLAAERGMSVMEALFSTTELLRKDPLARQQTQTKLQQILMGKETGL